MTPRMAAFAAYVERSLGVRRRQRDRPSEEVLLGGKELIELVRHLERELADARRAS